jgi:hypothetical protein
LYIGTLWIRPLRLIMFGKCFWGQSTRPLTRHSGSAPLPTPSRSTSRQSPYYPPCLSFVIVEFRPLTLTFKLFFLTCLFYWLHIVHIPMHTLLSILAWGVGCIWTEHIETGVLELDIPLYLFASHTSRHCLRGFCFEHYLDGAGCKKGLGHT